MMGDRFRVQVASGGRGLELACVDCGDIIVRDLPAQVSLAHLDVEASLHNAANHPPEFVINVMSAQSAEPIVRYIDRPMGVHA
jgi:hypothetical protein